MSLRARLANTLSPARAAATSASSSTTPSAKAAVLPVNAHSNGAITCQRGRAGVACSSTPNLKIVVARGKLDRQYLTTKARVFVDYQVEGLSGT